jgi:hypothetical protein
MGLMPTFTPKAAADGLVHFYGWYTTNGSSALVDGESPGVTVARTGVGTFTATLRDAYTSIVYAKFELGQATLTDLTARLKSVTTSTALGAIWDASDGAVAELPAANADTKLFYHIVGRVVATT